MNTDSHSDAGLVPGDAGAIAPGSCGHVVCIGASAGGLDALEKFFRACPVDSGAAFVVVQHLSPDHKSMMNNLLARHTRMPVLLVEDDMVLQADRVHLIPPGTVMRVGETGTLRLTPKAARGLTLPIDIFFSSLAERFGKQAIGIVLSGTGTDGTRGAEAINAAGGLLMAQEPESAKFDGMPRSAIAAGVVDVIAPAEDLPEHLIAHIRQLSRPGQVTERLVAHAQMPSVEAFGAILKVLHQVGGIDFSDYKQATIMRRIERRMQVRHTDELYQYLELIENDHAEALILRREMLISVTSFFRDAEAFALLTDKVIKPMVAAQTGEGTLRVWAAGVATGEEAYTLVMLFLEAFDALRCWPALKIFATDVDQGCVEAAAAGVFSDSAAAELSPDRLERFFVRKGDNFLVRNELRQRIVFARHNLLTDPPFTRMDLVVCRNTLIYFKSGAQERALRSLQYAVKEGGALMLGSSESLSSLTDGMTALSAKHKLFQRTGPATSVPFSERKALFGLHPALQVSSRERARRRAGASLADAGLALLLERYAPPAVVVNERREIVHLFGNTAGFLHPRAGSASLEINRQLPDALIPVASALLFRAEREREPVVSDPIEVLTRDDERRSVRLASFPLEVEGEGRLNLLCFESVESKVVDASPVDVDAETVARVSLLERELTATRENLQATIEELETSNEELQATNEELMASNEELQSSNEELQSLNEEMGTVNAEFQEKMLVLNRANADLDGMARATGVATIFVDEQMNITRYSPDATQVFRLRESDIGRRLDELTHVLRDERLMDEIGVTLLTGRMSEREVESVNGKQVYLTRILPYTMSSTSLRGAVLSFIDITAFHDARKLQAVLDALPEHVAVLDDAGTILMVNAAWKRFARANGDPELKASGPGVNYLNCCLTDACSDADIADTAVRGLRRVLEGSDTFFSLEYPCHSPHEQRWFVMNVTPAHHGPFGAVVSHFDISVWRNRLAGGAP